MLYGFMWLTVLVLGAPAVYLVNNHLFVNVPAYRRGVFAWIGTKGGAFRIPKVGETTELHMEAVGSTSCGDQMTKSLFRCEGEDETKHSQLCTGILRVY